MRKCSDGVGQVCLGQAGGLLVVTERVAVDSKPVGFATDYYNFLQRE